MMTSILLFENSNSKIRISWSIFFKNQPKEQSFDPNHITYVAGLKTQAKITKQLGWGKKCQQS